MSNAIASLSASTGARPTGHAQNKRACGSCNCASLLAALGCFVLFLLLVSLAYLPKKQGTERGPFDQDGIRTPVERLEKLAEIHANEAAVAHAYAWLDQSAGQLQIPIERAMELTAQRYSTKSQSTQQPVQSPEN